MAEELIFDDITTGASQDIKQETELAKAMVTKYGFSENVGLINYNNDDDKCLSEEILHIPEAMARVWHPKLMKK